MDRQIELFGLLERPSDTDDGFGPATLAYYGVISERQAQRYWVGACPVALEVIHKVLCNRAAPYRLRWTLARLAIPEASTFEVWPADELDLDVDRDGRITPQDALAATAETTEKSAAAMRSMVAALADGRIERRERGHLIVAIDAVVKAVRIARRVMERMG